MRGNKLEYITSAIFKETSEKEFVIEGKIVYEEIFARSAG